MSLTVNLLEALRPAVHVQHTRLPCGVSFAISSDSPAAGPGRSRSLQIPPVEGGGSRVKAPAGLRAFRLSQTPPFPLCHLDLWFPPLS